MAYSIGLRPWEFLAVTPGELRLMAEALGERELAREKESWRRFAFLAAETVNISGKSVRRPVKAKDYLPFDEANKPRHVMTPAELETRRQQAMETAKLHKAKFWEKISEGSIKKIIGDGHE